MTSVCELSLLCLGDVEVRPAPEAENRQPWPFGAFAGKYPPFEIEEIKAGRREALLGKAE